ncbi:glycoside hydrolase domain-containing protein [uncultured Mucilaginibacter sp.]|uniref:glycoside hydrolase domain-containing protein n=1 Tax=uncultured Mucilaginibacter sp. TaxID=797541 RepID=UPI0025DDEFD3|nr:glycoside hydrolase domain-containing protein [uncultured Mucilaginibacter sp.]
MKRKLLTLILLLAGITAYSQDIPYTNCPKCWLPDSLGNHRVVLEFNGTGKIAKAIIPWRRRDNDPQNKRIIIEDATTHQKVSNVKPGAINREYGEILFEPVSGKGTYYVYYMPYKNEGRSNYPRGVYLKPENTAPADLLKAIDGSNDVQLATVKEFQSIDAFNSFYPMEVIATKDETNQLIEKHKSETFLVFPEDRLNSIRMVNDLPKRWIDKGPQGNFNGEAAKGENFSFQLGVYALQSLEDVKVTFSDLTSSSGKIISAANLFCINTNGIGYNALPLTKTVDVAAGTVQAMWCGIDVPKDATAGAYCGKATITVKGSPAKEIQLSITVNNTLLADGGVNEPWKMTRLRWLNSTMAQQNTVIAPYIPLIVKNNTISLLGRKVEINKDGFPKQIQTFFTPEMTGYSKLPNDLLTEPIHFHFTKMTDGKNMALKGQGVRFTKTEPGTVQWKAVSSNDIVQMEVTASLEFDGFIAYTVKVKALQDVDLKDITMHIPFTKDVAKYMMGLGQKGGYRPDNFEWKWDVTHKNQDGAWIGNVNAGLQYSLRDEKYVRPLNTNFYLQKPLLLPSSWGNDNKGGIKVSEVGKSILADNYSGERKLVKGEELYYNFNLLITPFHPINTDFQWATRFYHAYKPIDTIKETSATVINIHHATAINPYLNYPFIAWKKMKAYDDSAHAAGLKVKIYNTIRELSNHAYETFALRSLGHEIYSSGKGGGFSWLQEHLGDDYIAAWFVPELKDAAIINSGMNRWHNYYVEGMNWLTQNVGIDGIYLDDVAFDRVTMKRIKRVLTADGHPGIIDLHSANQYNKNDGFNNSANLYMEHFPYLNRLWFGEYFDYEKNSPDFFLTEVSGIPFGLMGEMLQGGGNRWRGMVFGMTNRMPWSDNADPRPIWKVWDNFGMKGTQMIGYWVESNPVKTDNEKVLATIYKKKGTALVSIASWAENDTEIALKIDWKKLGIDPTKATITAPEIKNFQPGKTFGLNEKIPVEKGKGWLLIVK